MGHFDIFDRKILSAATATGRATLVSHGPISVTSLSWCPSSGAKMKPTSKKSATGRHDDLKCFSLLAARCWREIETVLKTVGQDSNLQPQQPPTRKQSVGADMRAMGRTWERWRRPAEPLRAKLCTFVCLQGAALISYWVAAHHTPQVCRDWGKILTRPGVESSGSCDVHIWLSHPTFLNISN